MLLLQKMDFYELFPGTHKGVNWKLDFSTL